MKKKYDRLKKITNVYNMNFLSFNVKYEAVRKCVNPYVISGV